MMNNKQKVLFIACLFIFNAILTNKGFGQMNRNSLFQGEDTIRLLYDTKQSKFLTGSVSYISGDVIQNIPISNILNALPGRVTGMFQTNVTGLPGFEESDQVVRGHHSFRNNNTTILIDGRPDDIRMLDPYDIESVSVLKDAAATVLYGLKSANGVILINTKKAQAGRVKVNFNSETSFSQFGRKPKFLDAYNYALLYNEALRNDNPDATLRYDQAALDNYQNGTNLYVYPNVNWGKEFLRDLTIQTRNNIGISGGNNNSKFYVAVNYYYANGLFNVEDDLNTYNTNSSVKTFNVHGNVETKVGNNLSVNIDIRAKKNKMNAPITGLNNGLFAQSMLTYMYSTPFNAHPIVNEDGSIAGTNDYRNNPYGMLNHKGYTMEDNFSLSTFADVVYNLKDLVKGFKIKALVGFNNYNDYRTYRTKNFAVYQLRTDGKTYDQIGTDTQTGNSGAYDYNFRNYQHYLSLLYSNRFGDHDLDAFIMYERFQSDNLLSSDLYANFQGPKGKVSYNFKDRYLVDFAFSYQGSEQFAKGSRYAFLPALSAGWIVSNENFLKNNSFVNFLKFRGSYGITANMPGVYFGYLSAYSGGSGYSFGVNPATQAGYTETKVENPTITWEKNRILNAGIDLSVWNNRLNLGFDLFSENNNDIMIQNAITGMYGATVYVPEGKFKNKGYELSAGWNDKINDFNYHVNFNYSKSVNEIVYQDEAIRAYPWMYRTGNPYGSRFGYVFDRYFTEQDDISSLPDQSLLGVQKPGDLKYKDLNEDGVIDENDIAFIGKYKMPEVYYGISLGAEFKKIDLNVFFEGTQGSTTYNSGWTYWDFYSTTGNVLEHHLDRWTPGKNQSASYPRLTLNNNNNYVASSYWVQDNSFFRLKYVELGYTLPKSLSSKIGMSKLRLFVNGNYLYTWDNVNTKDPDGPDGAMNYPLRRTFSVGFNISF